jgi:hypothetical protein
VRLQSPSGELTAYKALAPFFDLFNHDPSSATMHGLMNAQIGEEVKPALGVISGQEWAAGEEVNLNYGPEGNGRLISLYGFCVEPNPFDKVWYSTAYCAQHTAYCALHTAHCILRTAHNTHMSSILNYNEMSTKCTVEPLRAYTPTTERKYSQVTLRFLLQVSRCIGLDILVLYN